MNKGVVANLVAMGASLCAFPFLLLPVLKLGLVGLLVGGPLAAAGYLVAFVLIDAGPVAGVIVAVRTRGVSRVPYVTAALSLAGLVVMIAVVGAAGTQIDLAGDGRAHGPAPSQCKPASPDGSAVGRACRENGGPAPGGDCPDGYFCMVEVQGRPDTTCYLPCRHDCECPARLTCKFEHCVRR